MTLLKFLALSFALLAGGMARAEGTDWTLQSDNRNLIISGETVPETAELRLAGAASGTPLKIGGMSTQGFVLRVAWPLIAGTRYELYLTTREEVRVIPISLAPTPTEPARVTHVSPGGEVLPANALRLFAHFETPMARGNAHRFIRLLDAQGQVVSDAFLNIGVELWSQDQRRLTVLFDPGRIKRGVGPNERLGLSLVPGLAFTVDVLPGMPDALNRPLQRGHRHGFTIGPAERRAIDPTSWTLSVQRDHIALVVDRTFDANALSRNLRLMTKDGEYLDVQPAITDRTITWSIGASALDPPTAVFIAPALEDVAGNTLCSAFDTDLGQGKTCTLGQFLPFTEVN